MATLFLVHAHPDDEAITTGGVMRKACDDGHRVVLVTCTRGEEGEIHNMDEATIRPWLADVRTEELRRACEILGVERQEFLGYRDSGMAGTLPNQHPNSFFRASVHEAAERLARFLRQEQPEVVVTYTADGTYGHPDHIKAHQTTLAALDMLQRDGWRPAKLYLQGIPRSSMRELADRSEEEIGRPSHKWARIRRLGVPDEEITTIVDVRKLVSRKMAAFSAHISQNYPDDSFQSPLGQVFRRTLGQEAFVLARGTLGEPRPERDLFAHVQGSS